MNGDEVRAVRFLAGYGYDAPQVDDLLRRLAAELDAGRPGGPLIANATFRRTVGYGYEGEAFDWFLEEFLRQESQPEPAGMNADPWRDLPVVNLISWRGPGGLAEPRKVLIGECKSAWRDFGQLPGVRLCWRTGWWKEHQGELRTVEQQAMASVGGFLSTTAKIGGRSFTLKKTGRGRYSDPGVTEIADRAVQNAWGHFNVETASRMQQARQKWERGRGAGLRELVDETGTPILYVSGGADNKKADACISFPDGRWLRFLVRGTKRTNGVMTAVDQAGEQDRPVHVQGRGHG